MTQSYSNARVLELASKIECKMADIYRFFRKLFMDDEAVALLWEEMASEEEAHAGFLDAEFRMLIVSPSSFGSKEVEIDELQKTNERLIKLEVHLKENPPTLNEALSFAIQLEKEVVEKKYNRLLEIGDPTIKRIFQELTKDDHHLEKLVIAFNQLGDSGKMIALPV